MENVVWVPGHGAHVVAANDNVPVHGFTGLERQGDFIQTYTGRQFWPMDTRASEVHIEDIAHSLALQTRFAGHCLRFYSVAEHSVHIAKWLLPRHGVRSALAGLLHDGSEAYLCDVPRPVKPFLDGYKRAEARVQRAVYAAFALGPDVPAEVHEADNRILIDEREQNMAVADYGGGWPDAPPLGVTLEFWDPATAEQEFLTCFRNLVALRDMEEAA